MEQNLRDGSGVPDVRDEAVKGQDSGIRGWSPGGLDVSRRRLVFAAFIVFVILLAFVFPFLGTKFQLVLMMLPITVLVTIFILLNPYLGIVFFYLFDYGRLDYFIPPLRPLRVAILLEVVTLLSWTIHMIKTRRRIILPKFTWLFLGFLGVIASSVFTAMNNRHAYDIFESMSIYFMIYFISINVVDSFKRLNKLIWVLFIVFFLFSVKGIMGGGRAGGAFMGDENDFALAMNMMIPFAFFMFLAARDTIKKISILVILVTLTLAVISSMSRGGWVGLTVTLIFCVIKSKRIFVSMLITIILAIAVVSFAPKRYWDEIKTITDTKEATAASRLNYWKAAVRMYKDYPITGVGADNGGVRMPEYWIGPRDSVTAWGRAFHGTMPQVLAELGSLGMFFYLAMIITAFVYLGRLSRRSRDDPNNKTAAVANAIMVSIISYVTSATFLSTAYYPELWTLMTLTIILVTVTKAEDAETAGNKSLAESAA